METCVRVRYADAAHPFLRRRPTKMTAGGSRPKMKFDIFVYITCQVSGVIHLPWALRRVREEEGKMGLKQLKSYQLSHPESFVIVCSAVSLFAILFSFLHRTD